jgi:hypothetical protein
MNEVILIYAVALLLAWPLHGVEFFSGAHRS